MALETLLSDASAYELIAQLRYTSDYLASPGAQPWRERLARVDFDAAAWLAEARPALDKLQDFYLRDDDTRWFRETESMEIAQVLVETKQWLSWLKAALRRRALSRGGRGRPLLAQVVVGEVAGLSATAAHMKLMMLFHRLERAGDVGLDRERLEEGRHLMTALEKEHEDRTGVDSAQHAFTTAIADALAEAADLLRDLALARDEMEALDGRQYSGLKLGILAAAAARRGRPEPAEEDEEQAVTVPDAAAGPSLHA